MTMTDETAAQILRALDRIERTDIAGQIHRLGNQVIELEAGGNERHAQIREELRVGLAQFEGQLRGLSLRVREIEKDTGRLETFAADTGRHEILTLRDDAKWIRRTKWGAAGSFLLMVAAAVVAWVLRGGNGK